MELLKEQENVDYEFLKLQIQCSNVSEYPKEKEAKWNSRIRMCKKKRKMIREEDSIELISSSECSTKSLI